MPAELTKVAGQNAIQEDGKIKLWDGTLVRTVPAELAERYLAEGGYTLASEENLVQHRQSLAQRTATTGTQLKAGLYAAGRGALDVATAAPNLALKQQAGIQEAASRIAGAVGADQVSDALGRGAEEAWDESKEFSGARVLGGTRGLLEEAHGGEWAEGERGYGQESRRLAEAAPVATTVGRTAGEMLAGGGLIAGGRSLAARAAAGAVEGAVLGGAMAGEDAFLSDHELTAEEYLAGMGFGATLGAVIPAGMSGIGAAGKRAAGAGRKALRTLTEADYTALARGSRAISEPATGLGARLRELGEAANVPYAKASATFSGVDEGLIRQYGPLSGNTRAWRLLDNQAQVLDGATRELADNSDRMLRAAETITENFRSAGLKQKHVAGLLESTGVDRKAAKAASHAELDRIAQMTKDLAGVDDIASVGGNRRALRNLGNYVAAAKARAKDPASSFVELDKVKREMQGLRKRSAQSAAKAPDGWDAQQYRTLSEAIDATETQTRGMLENEQIWGGAGSAQRKINQRWSAWLQNKKEFDRKLAVYGQPDYATGKRMLESANYKGAESLIRGVGKAGNEGTERLIARHVDDTRELAKAFGEELDIDQAVVREVLESADGIGATLTKAQGDVKTINQLKTILGTERDGSPVLAGLGGYTVGGAPGAVAGAALARPGQSARQMAQIIATTNGLRKRIGSSLESYIGKPKPRDMSQLYRIAAGKAAKMSASDARPTRRLALPAAINALGSTRKERRKNYREKATALAAMRNPAVARETLAQEFGETTRAAPKMAGLAQMKAGNAVDYLLSKLPAAGPASLTPQLAKTRPSDSELTRFSEAWTAVTDPASVVEDLESGYVSQNQIECLKAVYPRLYQEIRNQATELLMAQTSEVPYRKAVSLNILLDLRGAGTHSLSPGYLARSALYSGGPKEGPQPKPNQSPEVADMHKEPLKWEPSTS